MSPLAQYTLMFTLFAWPRYKTYVNLHGILSTKIRSVRSKMIYRENIHFSVVTDIFYNKFSVILYLLQTNFYSSQKAQSLFYFGNAVLIEQFKKLIGMCMKSKASE